MSKNIAYAFFDMDGTITAPLYQKDDGFTIGFDQKGWNKFCENEGVHSYDNCKIVQPIIDFAKNLTANGCICYVLTRAETQAERQAKLYFIHKQKLNEIFKDCIFTNSDDEKLDYMRAFASSRNIPRQEIMLVEDLYYTCLKANNFGFVAAHTSNILTDTISY